MYQQSRRSESRKNKLLLIFNPYFNNYVVRNLLKLEKKESAYNCVQPTLVYYTKQISLPREIFSSRETLATIRPIFYSVMAQYWMVLLTACIKHAHTHLVPSLQGCYLKSLSVDVFTYRPRKVFGSYKNDSRRNGTETDFSLCTLLMYCHL